MKKISTLDNKQFSRKNFSPGYTLVEVMVAVMLAVNVLTGMMVGYTAIIRYVMNLQQKTQGSFAAFAALKLVVRELGDTSCTLETECPDFESIVYCTYSGNDYYVWGRKHEDPNSHGDSYVRFHYDASGNDLTYCSNAGFMGNTAATCPMGAQVTIAKDLDNDMDATPPEIPFTCDSENKQVTVILRSIEEKDQSTGEATRTRRFESTVKIPFGCDSGC